MPSFFGYILKYALVFLIPCFVVITYVFFSGAATAVAP